MNKPTYDLNLNSRNQFAKTMTCGGISEFNLKSTGIKDGDGL